MVRRALDEKNKWLLQYGAPLSTIFKDAKKFDIQNPIIAGLLSQVKANKLEEIEDLKNREIVSRLIGLNYLALNIIMIIITIIMTIVEDLLIGILEVVNHLFYLLKELPFL